MRIAFCGVGATGKSTLAKWIVENQESLGLEGRHELTPVGSRSTAAAMGFEHPYDVDRASRRSYEGHMAHVESLGPKPGPEPWGCYSTREAFLQVEAQVAAEEALRQFYAPDPVWGQSMRPVFQTKLQADKIAWELDHDAFVTDRTTIDDLAYAILHCRELVDGAFYDRALNHMGRYDVVFYCPLSAGQWLDGDGARQGDATYYRILDALMHGLFKEARHLLKFETSDQREWWFLESASLGFRQGIIDDTITRYVLRTAQP